MIRQKYNVLDSLISLRKNFPARLIKISFSLTIARHRSLAKDVDGQFDENSTFREGKGNYVKRKEKRKKKEGNYLLLISFLKCVWVTDVESSRRLFRQTNIFNPFTFGSFGRNAK